MCGGKLKRNNINLKVEICSWFRIVSGKIEIGVEQSHIVVFHQVLRKHFAN